MKKSKQGTYLQLGIVDDRASRLVKAALESSPAVRIIKRDLTAKELKKTSRLFASCNAAVRRVQSVLLRLPVEKVRKPALKLADNRRSVYRMLIHHYGLPKARTSR